MANVSRSLSLSLFFCPNAAAACFATVGKMNVGKIALTNVVPTGVVQKLSL